MTNSLTLGQNSRVAIVGGGPGGSFFALFLLLYASQKGFQPDINIYEDRHFTEGGPKGCKGCAGILAPNVIKDLRELNLTVPDKVIQSKIDQYTVHSPHTSISLINPEKDVQILSVYRGAGPRLSHDIKFTGFDGWLLAQAQERGAEVVITDVKRIILGKTPAIEANGQVIEYDFVVLATGTRPMHVTGLDYVAPRTRIMAQDELFAGQSEIQTRLDNTAHAFLIPHTDIIFGSLVPKGHFANVSILNSGKKAIPVAEFLKNDIVRSMLPENYSLSCGCRPRALIGPARHYYADRFVAVGDSVVSRLYKDGIGSALQTGRQAARVAVEHGISKEAFHRYYRPLIRRFEKDNRWGKFLFSMNGIAKDSRIVLLALHRLVGDEQRFAPAAQTFTKAAWGMFTGSYTYTEIARMVLRPLPAARLWSALWLETWGHLFTRDRQSRQIQVGSKKILILGSGFGGTYVLRHLLPRLNLNENIVTTLISDENFFLFTPLLHEVATGRIEPRHVAYSIRKMHWRDRFNFARGTVKNIDLARRSVATDMGDFDFDYLVISLGSVTDRSGLDQADANVFYLKTLLDSIQLRNHIILMFEQAVNEKDPATRRALLTFVIAGGGYTGVQMVGELRDYLRGSLLRFYKSIDPGELRVVLVESEPKIMGELHPKLAAYAMAQLRHMGVEVRLWSRVTQARDDFVMIDKSDKVPTRTLVWVAGVLPNPVVAGMNAPKDDIGRVIINEEMEIPGAKGVYAIGDNASFAYNGHPIPPRAHTTVRQAKVVAHNILAEIRGREKQAYRYSQFAEVVSIGAARAVFRVGGLRFYGIPARLVWLGAYSLLVTGFSNRIQIVMDWMLSLIFGRDTTYIKLPRDNGKGGESP